MLFRKAWSIIKWAIVGLVSLLFYLLAKLMAVVVFPVRHWIKKYKPFFLWYFIDSEEMYGDDSFNRKMKRSWGFLHRITGGKGFWRFWIFYIWNGWRNSAWNLQRQLKPREGVQIPYKFNGELYAFTPSGKKFIHHGSLIMANAIHCDVLGRYDKYGEFISPTLSIFGKRFLWFWNYHDNGKKALHWRYSSYIGKWNLQIGVSDNIDSPCRYIYKLKYKNEPILWDANTN